ncbi:MAG: PIG-L deacetylase family protein [Planctomycetota bacterium]|jgi:LmbE family N-acetylglucosaminyl deacetylase
MEFSPAAQPEVERRPNPDPGRVLCFAPHPDDETLGAGGTLYLHACQDDPVQVVVATDGTAGDPDGRFEPTTYGERRRSESRKAMGILQIHDVHFWGLPDSCVITEPDLEDLAARVEACVAEFEPDIVYLPWELDGNSDHMALHQGVVRGLGRSGFAGQALGYEVWRPLPQPDLVVDITEVVDFKRTALQHYVTQMAYADLAHPVFGMNGYRSLLLERDKGYGEAFGRVKIPSRES